MLKIGVALNLLVKIIKLILYTVINNSIHDSEIKISLNNENSKLNFTINYNGQYHSNKKNTKILSNSSVYSTVGHGISMEFCRKMIEYQGGHIQFFVNNNNINVLRFSIPSKNSVQKSICFNKKAHC